MNPPLDKASDASAGVQESPDSPAAAPPDVTNLAIEDGEAVESIFAEKLYRLLTDTLYSSWAGPGEGRTFIALANVGLFHNIDQPAVVPDVMLSLDVPTGLDLRRKENNSYFIWKFGKGPDVVIELVSDRRGGENSAKQKLYARLGIPYYVIFDPKQLLSDEVFSCHVLLGRSYQPLPENWFSDVGLGVKLWEGVYEKQHAVWLRWCDARGNVIPTGGERAERFAAKLRELGVDPETL